MTDQQTPSRAPAVYTAPSDNSSLALAPEAWKLASRIAHTPIVPKGIQGSPESVLAIILAGHEAGVTPMQALNKIHIVEGRVAMSAELMRALVLRAGHEIWIEEASSTRVVMKGSRKGSERVSTVTWTMDDAKRAKVDGKPNWRGYPRAMLTARASTELCRMLFADVLAGITHSVEELSDSDGDLDDTVLNLGPPEVRDSVPVAADASEAPTPRKAARAATTATGAPDPVDSAASAPPVGEVPDLPGEEADDESDIVDAELVEDQADDDDDEVGLPENVDNWPDDPDPPNETDPGPRLSGPQMIAMKLADHGITDRGKKLRAVEKILDREPGSLKTSKDLDSNDVATVLGYLEAQPEGIQLLVADETDEAPEPDPEPEPVKKATAVAPAEEWDGDRWRNFLKSRKVKVAPAIKEAQRLVAEAGADHLVGTLDDIAGSGIETDLVGWVEER